MKKYLLFLLFLFSFSILTVKADCENLLAYNNWLYYNNSNYFLVNDENHTYYFSLEPNTNYTLFFNDGSQNFSSILNSSITKISIYAKSNNYNAERFNTLLNTNKLTFNSSIYYDFSIRLPSSSGAPSSPFIDNNSYVMLVEGSSVCSVPTPTPIPTPTPTPTNNVYSSFITLYLDRINYLATGFTNNPYLLSMLAIIFAWIVLEFLLHIIHIKGGYKK